MKQHLPVRAWWILAAVVLARFTFGFQIQTVASLAPLLRERFGLDYETIGALIGAFMVTGIFAAVPLGLLARRFGDKPVLATGLAVMTLGATLAGLIGSPLGIGIGRAIAGIGAVSMVVIQGKILADWFPGRRLVLAISMSVCAWPVGVGLGQLIQAPIARGLGWPWAFHAGAALSGLSLLTFLASYRPAQDATFVPRAFSFPGRRECVLVIVGGMIWGTFNAGYWGFVSYVPSLLAERAETGLTLALVITVATWGNVPATLLGGGLATRFGGLPVFLIGHVSLVAGTAGIALFGWPVWWALLFGVVGSIHPGIIITRGTLSTRPEHRVVGLGLFYSTYYLCSAVLPGFCGRIGDLTTGPAGALVCAAAISVLAIPIYLLHRRLGARAGIVAASV